MASGDEGLLTISIGMRVSPEPGAIELLQNKNLEAIKTFPALKGGAFSCNWAVKWYNSEFDRDPPGIGVNSS
jgi:hypothetical protein